MPILIVRYSQKSKNMKEMQVYKKWQTRHKGTIGFSLTHVFSTAGKDDRFRVGIRRTCPESDSATDRFSVPHRRSGLRDVDAIRARPR